MSDLIPVAEADQRLRPLARPLPAERCPLDQAVGRVLGEPIVADRDLPPFDRVMMDGVAIRHQDLAREQPFTIVAVAVAGQPAATLPADPLCAVTVMTGCPLPVGADTVIPLEQIRRDDTRFRVAADAAPEKGQYIHRGGSDAGRGSELVARGKQLTAVEIGIAASCGCATLPVIRQPRVAVYGTGDELVPVERVPEPHQVRQSNVHAITAALAARRIVVRDSGHWSDEAARETDRLETALAHHDVVIIAGAVSKGDRDWIPSALNRLAQPLFHGVRQRPGKPMGVWVTTTGTVIFALPGNPVSALVGTQRYVIPFLLARQGIAWEPPLVALAEPFAFAPALTLFLPVKRVEADTVVPRPVNNSGDFVGLAATDGFVELPAAENRWTIGARAPFYQWP